MSIQLIRVEYKVCDVIRYYRQVDGKPLKEISAANYSALLKDSNLQAVESSQDMPDRFIIQTVLKFSK